MARLTRPGDWRLALRLCFLLFTLLWLQTAGLMHAVEHVFHQHDEHCETYFAAERLGQGALNTAIPTLTPPPPPGASEFFVFPPPFRAYPAFRARAPPLIG